jgi:hypothetical protein
MLGRNTWLSDLTKLRGSIPLQATMRRLIYDMYYAEEISMDIAIKLLDKLNKIRDKKRH